MLTIKSYNLGQEFDRERVQETLNQAVDILANITEKEVSPTNRDFYLNMRKVYDIMRQAYENSMEELREWELLSTWP